MWSFVDGKLRWEYMKDCNNELRINYWNKETKIQGELSLVWHDLGTWGFVPKLEVFDDAWLALYQCGQEFLRILAENNSKSLTKEEMKVKLLEIGFVDDTFKEF
jgi:hypothetical protein